RTGADGRPDAERNRGRPRPGRLCGQAAVKLFPASLGGPGYLRALRDPFPEVPFVPVGGVDAAAARDYLDHGAIAVGVGSPLIGDAAAGGDLGALRTRAAAFRAAITREAS
ncbi:LOW QUALITY PROTEIN: putative 2-dehydro-3-deoxyphosphogluconate aldolase/4-hydroxy-2-oxoglutarate aldolase, partial [Streptomyces himastatinicus ATCC 53653]